MKIEHLPVTCSECKPYGHYVALCPLHASAHQLLDMLRAIQRTFYAKGMEKSSKALDEFLEDFPQ